MTPRRSHPPLFDPMLRSAPAGCVVATIDGAARGNPGPAAYGVAFEDEKGKKLAQLASRLGKTTNNVAEYRALLAALACARQKGWRALKVRTDSELLARQLQGHYKVKSPELKPLHEEAQHMIAALDYFAVEAVPRRHTRAADKLANAALDGRPVACGRRRVKKPSGPAAEAAGSKVIRAVFQQGVFKPLELLDLAEGETIELTIRRR